jgi:SAM-dependent methyltransferase
VTRPAPPESDFYDAELRRHDPLLRAAADVRRGDRVLDIGCGTGRTTRDAGRAAVDGEARGVDTSADRLEQARRRTRAEGLRNVTYEHGDAQTHPFTPGRFDVCISRFGTMFFRDPAAAFRNIGRALRPGGRLVQLVWQQPDVNEWFTAPRRAIAGSDSPVPSAEDLVPFSLADPTTSERLLTSAGFVEIDFAAVHEPVYYGTDADAALDAALRLRHVSDLLDRSADRTQAVERLQALLRSHGTLDGVQFQSRAWIITSQRR